MLYFLKILLNIALILLDAGILYEGLMFFEHGCVDVIYSLCVFIKINIEIIVLFFVTLLLIFYLLLIKYLWFNNSAHHYIICCSSHCWRVITFTITINLWFQGLKWNIFIFIFLYVIVHVVVKVLRQCLMGLMKFMTIILFLIWFRNHGDWAILTLFA